MNFQQSYFFELKVSKTKNDEPLNPNILYWTQNNKTYKGKRLMNNKEALNAFGVQETSLVEFNETTAPRRRDGRIH